MGASNKKATVTRSPTIMRDGNSSQHADFQGLASNFHLARINSEVPDCGRSITKDQCDLGRSNRAIIVALNRTIFREGIPEQRQDAGSAAAAEIIWSNLQKLDHQPHSGRRCWSAGQKGPFAAP